MPINFENPKAFEPFAEPLKWRQDSSPHQGGVIRGIVLHGSPDVENAGHPLGDIVADPWTVSINRIEGKAKDIKVGDTLTRMGIDGEKLTVQAVNRDDAGWLLICSANERSPL